MPIGIYTQVLRQFTNAHLSAAGGTRTPSRYAELPCRPMQHCLAARHVETNNAGGPELVIILSCIRLVNAKDSHRALFRDRRQGARKSVLLAIAGAFFNSFKAATG